MDIGSLIAHTPLSACLWGSFLGKATQRPKLELLGTRDEDRCIREGVLDKEGMLERSGCYSVAGHGVLWGRVWG